MARETRATTGNSRPRVFPMQEPVVSKPKKTTRKPAAAKANTTAKRAPATKVTGVKPVGVTKKKAAAKPAPAKKTTTAAKAKGVVKKVEGAITGNTQKKAAGTKKIKGTDKAVAKK